jgi:hypothetical protein
MARDIVSIPKRGMSNVAKETGGSHAQVRFCCYGRLNRGGVGRVLSTATTARVAPPVNGGGIHPIQMMASSPKLPAEHFIDYSLVYPGNY